MNKKFEKLKALQTEASSLSNELSGLKAEANRVHWKIETIKQDSDDDTPMQPLVERLQSARIEIGKLEKQTHSLSENISEMSESLLNYAIRQLESKLDEDYAALNILKSDYDKAWRQLQNDENNRLKQASVKTLRDRKGKLEDSIREGERLVRQLQANSLLSLDKFFTQQRQEVAA